ncbi:MAG: ThiF family adenylyltransferase [Dehalococcoidales bacterium]|nr:ThiF family adenylyltransferase [Dehalococcoidales bacterium]
MLNRYSRQTIFPAIGPEGQKKLGQSYAVVIGCGALGSVISSGLVRSGIGKIRIIDRDFIEYHNLQRQILFDEEDVKDNIPKAVAAERYLRKVNSEVEIEGIASDVNYTNIERLVRGADIIMDALDNFETRLLINDAALKLGIPWVYGGAIGSSGMTMNIIPGETACYRCFVPGENPGGRVFTCDTAGVLNPAPWIVASLQVAEALKILVESQEVNRDLILIDIWHSDFQKLKIVRADNCPACRQGRYEFLDGKFGTRTTSLCGQNAVQVLSSSPVNFSLAELATRLQPLGEVKYNSFMLQFKTDSQEMMVFPDGRAIIKNTNDETFARGLYSKYIGA